MKIAILTFAMANNEGAVLQCYALKTYLESIGHSPFIVNLPLDNGTRQRPPEQFPNFSVSYRLKRKLSRLKTKIFNGHNLTCDKTNFLFDYEKRYKLTSKQQEEENEADKANAINFCQFRNKYLRDFTIEYFSEKDFLENYPDADLYIVGSDQVWNVNITRWQYPLYFFSFLKDGAKRISYAACMGGTENTFNDYDQIQQVKQYLKKFSYISVRNHIASNIIRKKFNLQVSQVLDPTFLLSVEHYDEIINTSYVDATGDIWINKFIINDSWLDSYVYISKELHLNENLTGVPFSISGYKYSPVYTIADWLKLIKTADFIFTDSFHVTVFSIIFKKQFIAMPSYKGGEGRIIDLLEKLGLTDRYFSSPNEIYDNKKLWKEKIDYDGIEQKLLKLKQESWDFLKTALQ